MIGAPLLFSDAGSLFKGAQPKWNRPLRIWACEKEGVHLWRMALDADDRLLGRFRTFLSEEERDRAARFRFEADRRRFIARKGAQRAVLARYLGIGPQELRFKQTEEGKLFLASPRMPLDIRFSTSSSDALGLVAVAFGKRIGIDVENKARTVEYDAIASKFFTPSEARYIGSLTEEKKAEAFLACWTAKEAYAKAEGRGISFGSLVEVSVPRSGGTLPSLFCPDAEKLYTAVRFAPAENYVATLVIEGRYGSIC
jgi:4'-phosphopantetheinyl transferase